MTTYKTICCKCSYTKIGRARIVCEKCKQDVTIDLIYLEQAINENNN